MENISVCVDFLDSLIMASVTVFLEKITIRIGDSSYYRAAVVAGIPTVSIRLSVD